MHKCGDMTVCCNKWTVIGTEDTNTVDIDWIEETNAQPEHRQVKSMENIILKPSEEALKFYSSY